jgi:colanic acid biosynthesis protein WcaH
MGKLPLDLFECIIKYTPLISIDLIVKKNDKFLLGRRINEPAKGFYFVPGGRIFKNERIEDAFRRITKEEIGTEIEIQNTEFLGIYEHFYENSCVSESISTHYIVLAYRLDLEIEISLPKEQHSEYIWMTKKEILNNKNIHPYAKAYFGG